MGQELKFSQLQKEIKNYEDQKRTEFIILIVNTPQLFTKFKEGQNPLKYALKQNKMSVARIMIKEVTNTTLNSTNKDGKNFIDDCIHHCIKHDRLDHIQFFSDLGLSLNKPLRIRKQQNLCKTSLDWAILYGNYEIAYFIYNLSNSHKNLKQNKVYLKDKKCCIDIDLILNGLKNDVRPQNMGNTKGCCGFIKSLCFNKNKKQKQRQQKLNGKTQCRTNAPISSRERLNARQQI